MKSYILNRSHFSDAFVKEIQAGIPAELHCIETRRPATASIVPPNVLCVISGSPTQQKERCVKIRFGGGSSLGALTVPLQQLRPIFEKMLGY
jgi:hypothetical protein